MDAVCNLEEILKLILKGYPCEFNENKNINSLVGNPIKTSENINSEDYWKKHGNKVLTSTESILKLYLENYETDFNVYIGYIFNQIQNLVHYVICNKTASDFPLDSLFNIIGIIVEIITRHPCERSIKTLTSFHNEIVDYIKLEQDKEYNGNPLFIDRLRVHLRIISVIYEGICNSESEMQCDSHSVEHFMKCMINGKNECEIFVKLLCENCEVLMIQTLIDVIPKFIKFTRCSTILELIWEKICNFYRKQGDFENSKLYIIYCYLSDFYFVAENKEMMEIIFSNSIYWIFIQNGLINSDAAVRKKALFLTKTTVNYIIKNGVNFSCSKIDIESLREGEKLVRKLPLIYWEDGMKFGELTELCVIIEYLEEKQVHLVKPIFNMIEGFLKNLEREKFDASWFLIVIQRMVSHDNIKIVREGIKNFMKINLNYYHEKFEMRKGIKLLLNSLNCTQIYMSELPIFLEELKTYFENIKNHENGKIIYSIVIEEMCDIQWSSEALYAVAYSLHSIGSNKCWGKEEINLLKRLLATRTANHYTHIKSGMESHLLLASLNLIDTCAVSLDDFDAFLNCYSRNVLQRKTILWESLVEWMRNFSTIQNAQHFITATLNNRNISRMILLLFDAFADNETFLHYIINIVNDISAVFVDIHARPYCDKQMQYSYLSIICDIMKESCGDLVFSNIFSPYLSNIVLYIKLQLESIYHIRDFELCKIYIDSLSIILDYDREHCNVLVDVTTKWLKQLIENFDSNSISEFPVGEYLKIRLVNVIMDYTSCETDAIESYLRGRINSSLIKTSEDLTLTKDLHTLWGRMNSEFSRGKWEILSKIHTPPLKVLRVTKCEFISRCFEALDLTGHTVLFPLIRVLGNTLPSLLDEPGLERLIDAVWKAVLERKKNEEYPSLIKQFVEALFQLEVIKNGNYVIREILINYCRHMSENTAAVANILVKHMQKIGFHKEGAYLLKELLSRGLIFGQTLRKDERLLRELSSIIETSRLSPLKNDFSSSNEVRARSIQIILTLNPADEGHSLFSDNLFASLTELEESNCRNRTRYFSDSHVHRVKQRLLQALLVLEPYMTKDGSVKLWNWLSNKILMENNQASVRYLQEWLMLNMMNRNPCFRSEIWTYFDESLEKRTGSLCSSISIIYHSVKCVPEDEVGDWIERAVNTFLPYCMAQHFTVRLYAQITLEKLLETAANRCLKRITEKYGIVKKSLKESIERGNAIKNCGKMRQDFYFSAFHPVEHYSLQTIFFEIPRLTNVNSEEYIPEYVFIKSGVNAKESVIPLTNTDDALAKFTFGKWILDGSKQEYFMEDSQDKEISAISNFQKKNIPLKYLMPDVEELLQDASICRKKIEKDGLVVVASLIDRLPNLGGLSRTCEVFGACELVIGSLKYVEDKQFQSLSVTAEKWVTMTEVKPFYLSDYLVKMKRNGYTVLAAEQTVSSQPLQSVKFPRKSLLLLGNEKEGIPQTLLPLMDVCIEIPQIGVIRSLNVHVTGALFIWEYAKQHHFL